MTVGFLLDAQEQGRLTAPDGPLSPALEEELTLRLVANQDHAQGPATGCRRVERLEVDPAPGDRYRIGSPVRLALARSAAEPPTQVQLTPRRGARLTFQLGGVPVVLSPPLGADAFELCDPT
jgi:hypothetical protein